MEAFEQSKEIITSSKIKHSETQTRSDNRDCSNCPFKCASEKAKMFVLLSLAL